MNELVKVDPDSLVEQGGFFDINGKTYEYKNGRVYNEFGDFAVLYSPGYGAGWSTWNDYDFMKFSLPGVVYCLTEAECTPDQMEEILKRFHGVDDYICTIGLRDLTIQWITPGTLCKVTEYDGSEGIETLENAGFFS